jgi:hypothetical protein
VLACLAWGIPKCGRPKLVYINEKEKIPVVVCMSTFTNISCFGTCWMSSLVGYAYDGTAPLGCRNITFTLSVSS